jgi:RNA polymerase sigma-70 factor (ECF subfamily)
MSIHPTGPENGRYQEKYRAFLETIVQLRPALHRYCARMVGSAIDGEDVVQEALFEAYRKLDQFDETRPLSPWLFRIAHNRSIDFLRRRAVRTDAEADLGLDSEAVTPPVEALGPDIFPALERLVVALPPKERACVLLKDVLGHSLDEIASIVDSTVGGVKSALVRARGKLSNLAPPPPPNPSSDPELARIVRLYAERFNQRDWRGVRDLTAADAQLRVVDRYCGSLAESPYFTVYESRAEPWCMAAGEVEGAPVVIIQHPVGETWGPQSVIRLRVENGQIVAIDDYVLCPWMFATVSPVVVLE